MSSNEQFTISVSGFDSHETGRLLLDALKSLLIAAGFQRDCYIDLRGDASNLRVVAYTAHWVIIANASKWRLGFAQQVTTAMQRVCPAATTEFEWRSS